VNHAKALFLGLALSVLASGAVTGPPKPKLPKPVLRSPKDSATAARAMTIALPQRDRVIPWQYSASPSNLWWDLQWSKDLQSWKTIRSNVSGEVTVTNPPGRIGFYRLQGRKLP
jgi:hypothetical protein